MVSSILSLDLNSHIIVNLFTLIIITDFLPLHTNLPLVLLCFFSAQHT